MKPRAPFEETPLILPVFSEEGHRLGWLDENGRVWVEQDGCVPPYLVPAFAEVIG
jgi:hypothetical protein